MRANTAGFSGVGLITELPVEDFRSVVDVCLTGSFLVIKHAAPRLRDGGALVSISSLNARQPAAAMSAYCAAKAGLSTPTQVAASNRAAAYPRQRGRTRVRAHPADRGGHPHPRGGRRIRGEHAVGRGWNSRRHRRCRAVPVQGPVATGEEASTSTAAHT